MSEYWRDWWEATKQSIKEKIEMFLYKINKHSCSVCGRKTPHWLRKDNRYYCSKECYERKIK